MILLSKSKYLAGCQCPRRLWLGCFAPELAAERDRADEARLALGPEIGRHAYKLFPGGVLVDQEAWRHGEAIARTCALVAEAAVPAIFEAAFVHRGVRVRVDILERLPDGAWGLREVKSGTRVREVHPREGVHGHGVRNELVAPDEGRLFRRGVRGTLRGMGGEGGAPRAASSGEMPAAAEASSR